MPLIDSSTFTLLLWALVGYGLGSIPFGLLLTQLLGLGNLRQIGSGNIGATNVLRTGNKSAAALTLLLDAGKGVVAVVLARLYAGEDAAQLAALMAMLGHCYPVWLGFKGGKGVATFLGLMWALAWPVGLGCSIAWALAAFLSRMSSMGGLMAAAASTFLLILTGNGAMLLLGILLTLLVFWRHRTNIARIRQGTEPKIGQKS
ncbi:MULTISPECIES: glycerol-3-phosphate 1-O-acyltransferase PlsY [Roseobacteraceae]|uniref:Glycerol-3-phosphate acyltransferase n=1 Tax=Pseudosulfitobacter pseudonitzschiae TaxID=1402135 RepID=A0A221K339_9RHOB|nr:MULTISPECIES: glycerol-3-phosphate 1-O-acyltransferase PlsY [Roseobacteraceae]ASM73283.1 glycerol-3-phosphate acyltransferase [Pseudosulfitobacter pseudonitzschiae]